MLQLLTTSTRTIHDIIWYPFRTMFGVLAPFHFVWISTLGGILISEIRQQILIRKSLQQYKQFNSECECRFVAIGEVNDKLIMKTLGPSFGLSNFGPLKPNQSSSDIVLRPRSSSSFVSAMERVELASAILLPWCREDPTRMGFAIGTSMVLASFSTDLYCTHVIIRNVVSGCSVESCSPSLPLNLYLKQVEEMDRDALSRAWAQF
jgi:hypothetical protein